MKCEKCPRDGEWRPDFGRRLCQHHYELALAGQRPSNTYPVPESCRRGYFTAAEHEGAAK